MNGQLLNEIYRVLFVESGDSIFIFSDRNWSLLEFNESASALLLYDRYEEKKPGLGDIIKNFDDSSSIVKFTKTDTQSIYLEDIVFLNRYEVEIPSDLQIFRINDNNSFLYLGIIIVDSYKKDSLRLRYEYISNISHELRAPLTGISGIVEMLQLKEESKNDIETMSYIDLIQKNIIRMKMLLDNLLRLDSTVRMQYIELFFPFEPIYESTRLLEASAKEKGIEITTEIDKTIELRGDRFEFSQIINNLLSNSIKYTVTGKIIIRLGRNKENQCYMEVTDSGVGIKKEYIPFLFNRFFRVPGPETKKVSGVGLGLWIVKELTSKMKGTITLESKVGVGTKFTLIFPLSNL